MLIKSGKIEEGLTYNEKIIEEITKVCGENNFFVEHASIIINNTLNELMI